MNALQKALVQSGLAETPKPRRKKKGKEFKCKQCGQVMYRPEGTNVMVCPECKNYILFNGGKNA